jgi:hypothetical protein
MFGALARAIRRESGVAVQHWWGVCEKTVNVWRRALGVPASTEGTHRLRVKHAETPANKRKLRKATLMSNNPEHHAKVSAALKGRKRPEHAVEQSLRLKRAGRGPRRLAGESARPTSGWESCPPLLSAVSGLLKKKNGSERFRLRM